MNQKEYEQICLAHAIFAGRVLDKDGYRGCPRCGSRNLLHDGSSLDEGYISCMHCHCAITGSDPYELVSRWNRIHRNSFQLEIPYLTSQ